MTKYIILLCFCCLTVGHAIGQKQGDSWVIGYNWNSDPNFSVLQLDFRSGNLEVRRILNENSFRLEACSNICDDEGSPLICTNGMEIRGQGFQMIEDTISYVPDDWDNMKPSFWQWWYSENNYAFGFPIPNGAIILPDPGETGLYHVIYQFSEWFEGDLQGFSCTKWLTSSIRLNPDSTFTLISKDVQLGVSDVFFQLPVKVVRHANGRDWWIYMFIRGSNQYQLILLDPSGFNFMGLQDSGINMPQALGLATISPSGMHMAVGLAVLNSNDQHVFIYEIDRCSGLITFQDSFSLVTQLWPGFGFSPSEKFLYTSSERRFLWQFDMESSDIGASRVLVGEYDGFVHSTNWPTTFGPIIQSPDGRLYVVPTTASNEYLHVIDRPDEPGTACKLRQHAINLTVPQGRSAPNIPNYRLGPLDGSPCDTLGLNNLATSRWRWEVDEPNDPLSIRFTDLSFYEPDTWAWDFDDDQDADIPSPIHTFPDYGLYHVCQTVENQYQRDSTCQWIELMPNVSVDDPRYVPFSVTPNPFTDELQITHHVDGFTTGEVIITDLQGTEVLNTGRIPLPITLELDDLPQGMYICTVREADGRMTSMKMVKSEM